MHAVYRRLMVIARVQKLHSLNLGPVPQTSAPGTAKMGNWVSQSFGGGGLTEPPSTGAAVQEKGVVKDGEDPKKLGDQEWKQRLSDDEYYICRQKGTERPFTGYYNAHKEEGKYNCVCCGAELFSSEGKFESGCGWPSFSQASGAKGQDDTHSNILEEHDTSHGMSRTEVMCKKCHSHLGHVFDDGPRPTGLRYCINSVSLKFKAKEQK